MCSKTWLPNGEGARTQRKARIYSRERRSLLKARQGLGGQGRDPPLHLTLSPIPGTGNSHLHCGSSDHGDHSERSAAYRVEQGLSNAKDGTGTLTTLKQPSPRREQARSGSPVEGSGSAVRRASPQQRPTATWLEVASTRHATPVSCRGREHALFEHECALPRYLLSCA